jgi:hypothetical protein
MFETVVSNLIIPFIALSLLSVMLDRFTMFLEGVMHRIPYLPDKFEWWFAYILVLSSSYVVCWQLDFQIFRYLGLEAKYHWFDWLLTSLIISGGSTFLKKQFKLINDIPSILNITSSFRRMFSSKYENLEEKKNEKNNEDTF